MVSTLSGKYRIIKYLGNFNRLLVFIVVSTDSPKTKYMEPFNFEVRA